MPGTSQNAAAETARIVAEDIAGGAAALLLMIDGAAPALRGEQIEALRFLGRRLTELADELRMELASMPGTAPRRQGKRAVA